MNRVINLFKRNPFPIVSLVFWFGLLSIVAFYQFNESQESNSVPVNFGPVPTVNLIARLTPETQTSTPGPDEVLVVAFSQTPDAIQAPDWEPQAPYLGIWLSKEEIGRLPISGTAWENLKQAADREIDPPDLSDLKNDTNVYVLAKALVYGRTGERHYRDETLALIEEAMGTEQGGETLALGRHLLAYVIAADQINLPEADEELDARFRLWLGQLLIQEMDDGRSLHETHEIRPNNWGTHAGASRAAVALYLGDMPELERTAQVFKGWLGDRDAYSDFDYGRLDWQANPEEPVGINPVGAEIEGHQVGGALPEEMRRGGRFQWPPRDTGYAWEGLQGAVVLAQLLSRAGYPAWEWGDEAILRAVEFLYAIDWPAEGDDEWQIWLINQAYGTDFPTAASVRPGKNVGWTDWSCLSSELG